MTVVEINGINFKVEKKLGIAALIEIVRLAGKVRRKIRDVAADGRFSFWEKFSMLGFLGDVIAIAPIAQQALDELKDLDQAELAQLVGIAFNELQVGNAEAAETFVREHVADLLQAIAVVSDIMKKW